MTLAEFIADRLTRESDGFISLSHARDLANEIEDRLDFDAMAVLQLEIDAAASAVVREADLLSTAA